jgi:hypothetical protein
METRAPVRQIIEQLLIKSLNILAPFDGFYGREAAQTGHFNVAACQIFDK